MHEDHGVPLSRRALLGRAGRAGLAVSLLPLSGLLDACDGAGPRPLVTATPRSTATSPATSTAQPDTRPVTIAITGDIMLGRSVNDRILAASDQYPFTDTAGYLRGFDLTVGNLECVVSTRGQPVPGKQYHFRADPRGFDRLRGAGFDVVSLANNHSGDFGAGAFTDMLDQLPAHGLAPLGGGRNLSAAHQPVIRTIRTTTIGLLAYCEVAPTSFAATRSSPGHAWLDQQLMQQDITAVRANVDFLIVFMHWGIEYRHQQTAHQQQVARLAVEAGADFIVGAHPHVVQPSETYHGAPIVYSLGNFVFDEMLSDDVRRGEVVALTVQGRQLVGWTTRASYIDGGAGQPRWA